MIVVTLEMFLWLSFRIIPWHPWLQMTSRRLLSCLVGKMSELNMRLLVGTNIKGGTDSLFFIEETEATLGNPHNFSSISLHKKDRLRLVDCKDMADDVRQAILQNGNCIQEETTRDYHHEWLNYSPHRNVTIIGLTWRHMSPNTRLSESLNRCTLTFFKIG